MRIDAKGDRWRPVPEAAADGHNIDPGSQERRGMGMPQGMKHDAREAPVAYDVAPIPAQLVRRIGAGIWQRKNKIVRTWPTEPEQQPLLKLLPAMYAQHLNRRPR